MKKKILAIFAGIITGFISIMICEYINHLVYPPPAGMDPMDFESIKAFIKDIPTGAFVGIWLGWMISAFLGGFVAAKIDPTNWKFNSYIIAAILLLASVINMYMIPHPIWMVVITVIGYYPSIFVGSKLAIKK